MLNPIEWSKTFRKIQTPPDIVAAVATHSPKRVTIMDFVRLYRCLQRGPVDRFNCQNGKKINYTQGSIKHV